MANIKNPKSCGSVPNKALHSRVSYLHQAAVYLAQQQHSTGRKEDANPQEIAQPETKPSLQPASRRLVSDLRSVSLKVQIRLSPNLKHSICKGCDSLLVDGSTCSVEVENRSKGGKKPWADVLVRKCRTCGSVRRFPLTTKRQVRKPFRVLEDASNIEDVRGDPIASYKE